MDALFLQAIEREIGLEGSLLPATLRRVAGKSEEIIWGLTQGSSVGNRATAGLMAATPLELAGGKRGRG